LLALVVRYWTIRVPNDDGWTTLLVVRFPALSWLSQNREANESQNDSCAVAAIFDEQSLLTRQPFACSR
jgi:hypothetical protein